MADDKLKSMIMSYVHKKVDIENKWVVECLHKNTSLDVYIDHEDGSTVMKLYFWFDGMKYLVGEFREVQIGDEIKYLTYAVDGRSGHD
jgi:hypothetical protein